MRHLIALGVTAIVALGLFGCTEGNPLDPPARPPVQPTAVAPTAIATAVASQPQPTTMPAPTQVAVATRQPFSSGPGTWSAASDFTTLDGSEIPLGDAHAWVYMQIWNGRNTATTKHVAFAPGLTLRVQPGWKGTRWHVSSKDEARFKQMVQEVVRRDRIPEPPLIIVERMDEAERVAELGFLQPFQP